MSTIDRWRDALVERLCEQLCEQQHDAYEAAAAAVGWATQAASRRPWADVPDANRETMRRSMMAVLDLLQVEGRLVEPVTAPVTVDGPDVEMVSLPVIEWEALTADAEAWRQDLQDRVRQHDHQGITHEPPDGDSRRLSGLVCGTGIVADVAHHHHADIPAPGPGQHLWTILGVWRVTAPDPRRQVHLDTENLLSLEGPGCYVCEQLWSPAVAAAPCPGDPADGPGQ